MKIQFNFYLCLNIVQILIAIGAVHVQEAAGRRDGAEQADITVSKLTTPSENDGKLCLWGDLAQQPTGGEKTSTTGLQATPLQAGKPCCPGRIPLTGQ